MAATIWPADLPHWPGIMAELQQRNIPVKSIGYVVVEPKPAFIRENTTLGTTGYVRNDCEVRVVPYLGKAVIFTLGPLIYVGDVHKEELR